MKKGIPIQCVRFYLSLKLKYHYNGKHIDNNKINTYNLNEMGFCSLENGYWGSGIE